jgi:hypothetical protein
VKLRHWKDIAAELQRESNPDRIVALATELTRALEIEQQQLDLQKKANRPPAA